jgi:hypothetical protein
MMLPPIVSSSSTFLLQSTQDSVLKCYDVYLDMRREGCVSEITGRMCCILGRTFGCLAAETMLPDALHPVLIDLLPIQIHVRPGGLYNERDANTARISRMCITKLPDLTSSRTGSALDD